MGKECSYWRIRGPAREAIYWQLFGLPGAPLFVAITSVTAVTITVTAPITDVTGFSGTVFPLAFALLLLRASLFLIFSLRFLVTVTLLISFRLRTSLFDAFLDSFSFFL
jgi:hypothetical protein